MDRDPGLSVRLKLTLSYAGFLVLAGALLLALWVVLLRLFPHAPIIIATRSGIGGAFEPGRSYTQRAFGQAATVVLAFLLLFGLLGGWLLAGRMLAPLTRITDAREWPRADRSPTESGYRAAEMSSANSPTPSTPCSRGSKHTSPNNSGSQPMPQIGRASCRERV